MDGSHWESRLFYLAHGSIRKGEGMSDNTELCGRSGHGIYDTEFGPCPLCDQGPPVKITKNKKSVHFCELCGKLKERRKK